MELIPGGTEGKGAWLLVPINIATNNEGLRVFTFLTSLQDSPSTFMQIGKVSRTRLNQLNV